MTPEQIAALWALVNRNGPSDTETDEISLTLTELRQLLAHIAKLEAGRDAEPCAYLHTLTYETGEGREKLSFDPENGFGVPGKDYSESYSVSIEPLYTHPPVVTPIEPTDDQRHEAVTKILKDTP